MSVPTATYSEGEYYTPFSGVPVLWWRAATKDSMRTLSYSPTNQGPVIYTYAPTSAYEHSSQACYVAQQADPCGQQSLCIPCWNNHCGVATGSQASPTSQEKHTSLDDLISKLRQIHKKSKRRTVREGWSIGSALNDDPQVIRKSGKSAVPLRGYGNNEQSSKRSAFQVADRDAAITGGQIAPADFNKTWWSQKRIIGEGSVAYQRFIREDSTYLRYHPIEEREHACST